MSASFVITFETMVVQARLEKTGVKQEGDPLKGKEKWE